MVFGIGHKGRKARGDGEIRHLSPRFAGYGIHSRCFALGTGRLVLNRLGKEVVPLSTLVVPHRLVVGGIGDGTTVYRWLLDEKFGEELLKNLLIRLGHASLLEEGIDPVRVNEDFLTGKGFEIVTYGSALRASQGQDIEDTYVQVGLVPRLVPPPPPAPSPQCAA